MAGWIGVDVQPIAVRNPAAGAGFTYQVPASQDQIIVAVCFTLVTAVAVAARKVALELRDGAGVAMAVCSSGFTQAASLTTQYSFAVGFNVYGANDAAAIGAPMPLIPMPGIGSAVVTIANVQAADQVSLVRVTVAQQPYVAD